MEPKKEIRKRKILLTRCPGCGGSQIRKRKFLDNWICQKCKKVFKHPISDVKE